MSSRWSPDPPAPDSTETQDAFNAAQAASNAPDTE
jgi:hypothetical protein